MLVLLSLVLHVVAGLSQSPDAECDATSQLQSHQAFTAKQGADPCQPTIDTGLCQADASQGACIGCTGQSTIPSSGGGFPDGSLTCKSEFDSQKACEMAAGASGPYTFKDENDYLSCEGRDTCLNFQASSLARACCSGAKSCDGARVSLNDQGTSSNDVCCKGTQSCSSASMFNIRSMSCDGVASCFAMPEVYISKDLYCKERACGGPGNRFFAGSNDHCLSCVDGSCGQANFLLVVPLYAEATGIVTMNTHCSGTSCNNAKWTVPPNTKLRLLCEDSSCRFGQVTLQGRDSHLDLICVGGSNPRPSQMNSCHGFHVNKHRFSICKLTRDASTRSTFIPAQGVCNERLGVTPPERCMEDGIDADPNTACCASDGEPNCGAPKCSSTSSTTTTRK